MTWLNINPKTEPFQRKYAALLLSQKWEFGAILHMDNLSTTELAELYNNAEALGLDLYSLGQVQGTKVKICQEDASADELDTRSADLLPTTEIKQSIGD